MPRERAHSCILFAMSLLSLSELSLPTRAVSYTDSTGSTDGGTTPRSTIANNLIASSPPSILEYHSPSQRTNLSLHISSPASSDTTFTSPSSLLDFLSHDERPAREEPSSLSSAITKFLQEGEEEVYNVDHDTEEVLDNEITSMFEDEVAAEDIDDMYILDDDSEVNLCIVCSNYFVNHITFETLKKFANEWIELLHRLLTPVALEHRGGSASPLMLISPDT